MLQQSDISKNEVTTDESDLLYEAQQALISHDSPTAISLYTRALDSSVSTLRSAAALSLGKLYSSSTSSPISNSPILVTSPPRSDDQLNGSNGKRRGTAAKARDVEGMNKAGGCFLVGLAWDLEKVQELVDGEAKIDAKGKGKARRSAPTGKRQNPDLIKSLESANELSSNLLSLYRRNFITPSDPCPLFPTESLPSLLSIGDDDSNTSIWGLGEKLAERALNLPWLLEQTEEDGLGDFATLRISISIHLHYLLALTTHSPTPDVSLAYFRTITQLGNLLPSSPSNSQELQSLLTSASKRIDILQSKVARTPGRLDISSHLHLHLNNSSSNEPTTIDTPLVSPGGLHPGVNRNAPAAGGGRNGGSTSTSASGSPIPSVYRGMRGEVGGGGKFTFPRQKSGGSTHLQPTTALAHHHHPQPSAQKNSSLHLSAAAAYAESSSDGNFSSSNQDSEQPSGMRRSPSTFSNLTTRTRSSLFSLSPSILSMRLSNKRSTLAEVSLDDSIAEGTVSPGGSSNGGIGKGWFGSGNRGAMGSLRKISLTKGDAPAAATAGNASSAVAEARRKERDQSSNRTRIQSLFNPTSQPSGSSASSSLRHGTSRPGPPSSSSTSHPPTRPKIPSRLSSHPHQPPSPSATPPALTLPSTTPSTPKLKPTTKPSLSDSSSSAQPPPPTSSSTFSKHGDPSLDPHLRQLELDSKMTQGVRCGACGREAMNLPACPKCKVAFCSRECRVGVEGGGDGKKHVCGLAEKRKEERASRADGDGTALSSSASSNGSSLVRPLAKESICT